MINKLLKIIILCATGALLFTSQIFAVPAATAIGNTEVAPVQAASESSATLNLDASTKKPNEYWSKAVAKFKSEETSAPRHGVVLFGDSITARWPEGKFPAKNVINRGIGGDHIGGYKYFGLLDRMDTSIKNLQPARVYLLIGVNDMLPGGPPMANMKLAYNHLLDEIIKDAPGAEIYVQSILPVSKPEFEYMKKPIIQLNREIKKLADEKHLHFVDLYPHFVNDKEDLKPELTVDGVHLTPAGYDLWIKVLKANNALPE